MYGCCGLSGMGDLSAEGDPRRIPWSYLGQDSTDGTVDIMGPTLEEIAGGPIDNVTAGDIAQYATSGNTSDPSVLAQVTNIVRAAGPTVQDILRQIQLGEIASSTPIQNLPALRAAIVTGQPVSGAASVAIQNLTSSPIFLIGAGLLLVMLLRRRGA